MLASCGEQGCSLLLYVNTGEGDPNRVPKERIQNFKRRRHDNKERERGQEQRLSVPGRVGGTVIHKNRDEWMSLVGLGL